MSKQGIRALVYVSLVSAMIWGATGYLLVTAVSFCNSEASPRRNQAGLSGGLSALCGQRRPFRRLIDS